MPIFQKGRETLRQGAAGNNEIAAYARCKLTNGQTMIFAHNFKGETLQLSLKDESQIDVNQFVDVNSIPPSTQPTTNTHTALQGPQYSADLPSGKGTRDGALLVVSGTQTSANKPALTATDVLWYRVTVDGSTASVQCQVSATQPSDSSWSSVGVCYSSSAFQSNGGRIGFSCDGSSCSVDDLEVRSFNTATSAYDTIEQVEPFTVDSNGYSDETMQYDAAGNLSYDGVESYAYDAWNRLISVAHAYRDDSGTLHTGQVFQSMTYDGQGRRIVKAVTGTGTFDCTYHYYYDQDKAIETRNGSDQTLKQQVWGIQYVDELVQVAVNADPSADNTCETLYWAMQDANWNVLGIVDDSGVLTERYEYTPYGQRTVFFSPGANDPGCYAPTLMSRRVINGSVTQPYGLCEFGHQGLMHDALTGLVYNRPDFNNGTPNQYSRS
jgi:YD repeat-containing protein